MKKKQASPVCDLPLGSYMPRFDLKPKIDPASGSWEVQVKGKACSKFWEISIVRQGNQLGHESWGWFDDNKLLVSHNGGPCHGPLIRPVWDRMIRAAHEVCDELNVAEEVTRESASKL